MYLKKNWNLSRGTTFIASFTLNILVHIAASVPREVQRVVSRYCSFIYVG